MARGNMQFETETVNSNVEILKRAPFEGIPMTLDFSDITTKNSKGVKVFKAGSPVGADGKVDNTATVVGILLHDVLETRPQGTLLKKAYINTEVAEENAGLSYAAGVKTALPMVVFE